MGNKFFLSIFRLIVCAGLALGAVGQTVESIPFRALLKANTSVPQNSLPASGTVTIWVRVVRNSSGKTISASVDVSVQYSIRFPHGIRGLKLYRGMGAGAGTGAELVLDTKLVPFEVLSGGNWYFEFRALPLLPAQADRLMASPGSFNLSLETAEAGQLEAKTDAALEGPLVAADQVVLLTRLEPAGSAVPGMAATGIGAVHLIATRDRRGRLTSAEILLDINADGLPGGSSINSLQLLLDGGTSILVDRHSQYFAARFPIQVDEAGRIRYRLEVEVAQASANIVTALLRAPTTVSLSVNTRDAGDLRGRMHGTDRARFIVPSSANPAAEICSLNLHSLRDQTGKAIAALAIYDAGREPNSIVVTGVDEVRLFKSPAQPGFPPYNTVNLRTEAELASLNALLEAPETFSVAFNSLGPMRLAANSGPPVAQSVISAVWDPQHRTIAPGGLFTVFGRNLTSVGGDLAGLLGNWIPTSLNGTSVLMAGRLVPILDVRPDHVIAQVPADMPVGSQPVVVRTPKGDSAAIPAVVLAAAPAVFFSSTTREGPVAAVYKNNGTAVSMENPARPNDLLLFFSTGFGPRTTPAMVSGITATESPLMRTPNPTVLIGGRPAAVLYSVLAPGLVGIVQTAVRMPQSAGSGNIPLVVSLGDVRANAVILFAALR